MNEFSKSNINRFIFDITKAYEKEEFCQCLYLALQYLKTDINSRDICCNIAALRIIRFSAEKLIDKALGESSHRKQNIENDVCSFCFKSGEDMCFVNGVSARICYDCIRSINKELG
jgi:hypothetical protein